MKRLFLTAALLSCVLISSVSSAAEHTSSYYHDRTATLSVRSVTRQDGGMVWFGTDRSLYSFDGYDLTPHPCPDGHIQINKLLIVEDTMLIGTNNGLYTFTLKEHSYIKAVPFDGYRVRDLLNYGPFVYIGTDNGFYRYDRSTDTAVKLFDGDILSLALSGGILYVGMRDGIGTYSINSGTFSPSQFNRRVSLATCIIPDDRYLWVGTPTRLLKIDRTEGKVSDACQLPVAKTMCRDGEGCLLVGTDNGLFRYDPSSGIREEIHPGVIWSGMSDSDGMLWFGTDNGLMHLQTYSAIQSLVGLPKEDNTLYSVLLHDKKGRLWVGGSNGLYLLPGNGTSRHYSMFGSQYHIPHNKVRRIVEDPKSGTIYIASDGGILYYDETSGNMVSIRIPGIQNWVYDLIILHDEIWAATFEGLFRVNSDGSIINQYCREEGLTSNDVARIVQGRDSRIWAFTRDQRLFRIDPTNGEVLLQDQAPAGPDSMCGDSEGRIWISAGNRIARIAPQRDDADIRSVEFYPDANIESFSLTEAEGRIWLCTSEGLFSIDKTDLSIRSLGTYRNYVSVEYDPFRKSLLLGTAGSVDEVRISDLRDYFESDPPALLITGLTVNGSRRIDPDTSLPQGIKLPHSQNNLEVSFSDFNFDDEVPHRFVYWLDCRNEHASGMVTGNKVTLTGLRPGRYSLAVAPAGIAGEPRELLSFRIQPPWYLSPWMLLLYALLIAGAVNMIIKLATTRRYLELERRQRDELAEQSRQKEAFIQDLAHELKTPLSLVIGPLGKMIREAGPDTDITDLQLAQENAMRLSSLIHKTIDYYKGSDGVAETLMTSEIEFVDFARSIFDSWRENFPKHEFIFNSSHKEIPASIDVVKIEKVLNNLMSNACKYTPEGGSVLMTIERDDIGGKLVIKVSDTGIGIPKEELPFAFQRYFESSRTKQGGYDSTGIGLSIIKKYIEVHNGKVSVSSDSDGTTFTIVLPCLAQSAPAGSPEASSAGTEDSDKPLIAIVDDNVQICSFLESLLKDDYRCVCSHNGKSGLKLCKDVLPDLVISDVLMPVMDGMEMCRQIRQIAPLSTIPIIMLTAKDDKKTEQESIGLNIDVFFSKPFDVPTLTARVKQLLGNRKRMEQRVRMEMLATPEKPVELSQDELFLKKVTQLIEEHLDDTSLSVSRLCELGQFPEKQLYRRLKQFTGQSAVEYIRSIRLKKAALLLQSGNFTISEVMYNVGFSNASYFTRAFSSAFGMTPSEYLKSFKNK
ncbi:MAG: response regulator [Bacteroidales bacterium]|nr:response regulator [Bacteroidales bacterium]